jgi:diguanylate cyclase (GGDEF)-like protein
MFNWFARLPIWLRIVLKSLLVLLIGLAEYVTGDEISLSIFYLIPVALTAWIDGKYAGGLVSVICGFVWIAADMASGHVYSKLWIPFWNMAVRVGFFIIISIVLAKLKFALVREQEMARTDALTNIGNLRHFMELMERESERCRRISRPLTVAYFDLDNFKKLNDQKGHAAGDALLREVGRTLKQTLRGADVLGRLGGDEFGILLPEADYEQASVALLRVKNALERLAREFNCSVTFSIGAVTFQPPDSSVEVMIRAADDLMYQVKQEGKGAIRHVWEKGVG